jgi:hypothetical protein
MSDRGAAQNLRFQNLSFLNMNGHISIESERLCFRENLPQRRVSASSKDISIIADRKELNPYRGVHDHIDSQHCGFYQPDDTSFVSLLDRHLVHRPRTLATPASDRHCSNLLGPLR